MPRNESCRRCVSTFEGATAAPRSFLARPCVGKGSERMRTVAILVTIPIFAAAAALAAPADVLDVKSSLAGVVQEEHLVKIGDQVEDAQPLVYVRTALTGAIGVAARAPPDGVIRELPVRPGQRIERGDVVVRRQPKCTTS